MGRRARRHKSCSRRRRGPRIVAIASTPYSLRGICARTLGRRGGPGPAGVHLLRRPKVLAPAPPAAGRSIPCETGLTAPARHPARPGGWPGGPGRDSPKKPDTRGQAARNASSPAAREHRPLRRTQ